MLEGQKDRLEVERLLQGLALDGRQACTPSSTLAFATAEVQEVEASGSLAYCWSPHRARAA